MSMHPLRKRKLQTIIIIFVGLALATALMLYALRQNISLFYSPSQVASGEAPLNHSIRVGGMVLAHSIQREPGQLLVHFKVSDYQNIIDVVYTGVLPDLFREGQGIVVQGQLIDRSHIKASQVLAKHDEKYMPPEVKNALKPPYVGIKQS